MRIARHTAATTPQLGENDLFAATGGGVVARIVNAATSRAFATTCAAALAFGLFFPLPVSNAIDSITNSVTSSSSVVRRVHYETDGKYHKKPGFDPLKPAGNTPNVNLSQLHAF